MNASREVEFELQPGVKIRLLPEDALLLLQELLEREPELHELSHKKEAVYYLARATTPAMIA
jgi:hypothetical protein